MTYCNANIAADGKTLVPLRIDNCLGDAPIKGVKYNLQNGAYSIPVLSQTEVAGWRDSVTFMVRYPDRVNVVHFASGTLVDSFTPMFPNQQYNKVSNDSRCSKF